MSDKGADLLRARVSEADRLRRSRAAAGRLWRIAPAAAAVFVAVAIAARLAGWAPLVTIGTIAVGTLALVLVIVTARRPRPVSDTAAAEIDAHANLDGELRSAHWFAQHAERDPWVDFHLSRAVERVQAIDWSSLYPAPSAGRSQLATAALTTVALAVALLVPGRTGVLAREGARAPGVTTRAAGAISIDALTPEMLAAIEDAVSAAEAAQGGTSTANQVQSLLEQLRQLRGQKSVPGATPDKPSAPGAATEAGVKDLAERAKRAAEDTRLPENVREPLAEVADTLAEAARTQPSDPKNAQKAAGAPDDHKGQAAQTRSTARQEDAAAASAKDTAAGAGMGVIMMAEPNPATSKEGGQGLGSGAGQETDSEEKLATLGAALRKETIAADADNPGDNVLTELRRKTGHGDASVGFTRSAGTAERGRATAPPPVPEARRAAVKSYFVRKP